MIVTPELLMPVLAAAWGKEQVRVELIEFQRGAIPQGRLEFHRSGLTEEVGTRTWRWRGRVIYARNRSVQVLARVRLHGMRRQHFATRPIAANQPIGSEDFRTVLTEGLLTKDPAVLSPQSIAGMVARVAVASGEEIVASHLARVVEVKRGDQVTVHAESEGIHLKLSAQAETDGARGARILLRTSLSRRLLTAYVCGPAEAAVTGPGSLGCAQPPLTVAQGEQHE
jgi:flagella basal body P-ring formation protein FlgA